MKRYNGFKAERATARELLPAGGYVAQIKGVEERQHKNGASLVISFDIAEGEYKGFFASDYRGQNQEDKKWRGTYWLNEPKEDGTEQDGWTIRSFNNAVASLEDSNPGYSWNWEPIERGDFSQLKGKTVGVLFRNKEYGFTDNAGKYVHGWTTECCALTAADDIRSERFKMPKDKALSGSGSAAKSAAASVKESFEAITDDDLPFD